MPNSGIEITKPNGNLILNDTYQNFYLTAIGTYESENTESLRYSLGLTLEDDGSCSFLANGANGKDYYIFSNTPRTPSENGAGIQVFDDQGKVIYDSMWKPMKVLHVGIGIDGHVLPADKECAIVTTGVAQTIDWALGSDPMGPKIFWTGLGYTYPTVQNGIVTSRYWYAQLEKPTGNNIKRYTYTAGKPEYLLLDVTHFKDTPTTFNTDKETFLQKIMKGGRLETQGYIV